LNNISPGVRKKCKRKVSKNNIKNGVKPLNIFPGGSLENKKGNITTKESKAYAAELLINKTDKKHMKTNNNFVLGSRK